MAFSGVRGGNFGGIFELDGCKVTAAPSPSPLLPLVTLDILGAAAAATPLPFSRFTRKSFRIPSPTITKKREAQGARLT